MYIKRYQDLFLHVQWNSLKLASHLPGFRSYFGVPLQLGHGQVGVHGQRVSRKTGVLNV